MFQVNKVPFVAACSVYRLLKKESFPIKLCTYAPDNEWFIETMNTVFSLGGDKMQPDLPNSFLKLLSEGERTSSAPSFCCIF